MRYEKGKKLDAGGAGKKEPMQPWSKSKPGPVKPIDPKANPWIDKRHFDVLMDRCIAAEKACKDLIRIIMVDDGEFLASHTDYLAAVEAIKKGEV